MGRKCQHIHDFVWNKEEVTITIPYTSNRIEATFLMNCEKCGETICKEKVVYERVEACRSEIKNG
jgi:formylmethanofuran dehydrogenase subunit E